MATDIERALGVNIAINIAITPNITQPILHNKANTLKNTICFGKSVFANLG